MYRFAIPIVAVVFLLACSPQVKQDAAPAENHTAPDPLTVDLVAQLPLDGTLAVLGDSIFATAHGTLRYTADRRDSTGMALQLNNAWVRLDSFPLPDTLDSFTVSAWIDGYDGAILATPHYSLYCVHRRLMWGVPGSQEQLVRSRSPLLAGQWYFVAGIYEQRSGMMRLYINGMLEDERYTPLQMEGGRGEATLGRGELPGGRVAGFTGRVDDVRVWHRALSEQELQALYTAP